MKTYGRTTDRKGKGRISAPILQACVNGGRSIRDGIDRIKSRIREQHAAAFRGQERLLHLALNEAEALAWQTDYPHLFFPELALEKAAAASSWQQRQRAIQHPAESAFAA